MWEIHSFCVEEEDNFRKELGFGLQIFKIEISFLGHVSSLILSAVNKYMTYIKFDSVFKNYAHLGFLKSGALLI